MDEDKKKNNDKKESQDSYSKSYESATTQSYQKQEPKPAEQKQEQRSEHKNNQVQVQQNPITKTVQATRSANAKVMDAKVAHMYQLLRVYKDKVAEYRKTQNKEIKLWKFFWEVAQYILESGNTKVMDAFFKEYVHDEDLFDPAMALRFIFECKDVHVKNTVTAFYQVNDSLRRYFADRAQNSKARCYLSIRAIARTFDGHSGFVAWVNQKKNK